MAGTHYKTIADWWSTRSTRARIGVIAAVAVVLFVIVEVSTIHKERTIETVRRADVVRTVSANGIVVSSTDLALSFEASAKIDSVKVKVGDEVKKGDILATQKSTTLRAAATKARGNYLAAQARYKDVLEGSSNEEIALAQTNLDTTKKIQDTLVEQARRAVLSDGLVAAPQDDTPATDAPVISGSYTATAEGEYRIYFSTTTKEAKYSGLEKGTVTVSATPQALGTKGLTIAFPDASYSLGDSWRVAVPNTASANYTLNINAYARAIDIRDAAIATREAELNLKRATARQADVDGALAEIVIAQAQLESANAALERTILRAPADGTITHVALRVGATPKAFETAIVLQDISNLYIEGTVSEEMVGQIVVGQNIAVTFPLQSGTTYRGAVSSVDPIATMTDQGAIYKVKALLSSTTDIMPGMSADMIITTGGVSGVLTLSRRAIIERDNEHYVELITDKRNHKTVERVITTGLQGDGGMVEVTSGLSEGDRIAVAETTVI